MGLMASARAVLNYGVCRHQRILLELAQNKDNKQDYFQEL
jgi:hypothetical protein